MPAAPNHTAPRNCAKRTPLNAINPGSRSWGVGTQGQTYTLRYAESRNSRRSPPVRRNPGVGEQSPADMAEAPVKASGTAG